MKQDELRWIEMKRATTGRKHHLLHRCVVAQQCTLAVPTPIYITPNNPDLLCSTSLIPISTAFLLGWGTPWQHSGHGKDESFAPQRCPKMLMKMKHGTENPHMMTTFVILVHSMLMPSFTCLATNNCTGSVTLNTKAPKSPVHLALDLRLLAVPLHLLDPNTETRHPNLSPRNFDIPSGWGNVWDFVVGNLGKCLGVFKFQVRNSETLHLKSSEYLEWYCWWPKSCTSW